MCRPHLSVLRRTVFVFVVVREDNHEFGCWSALLSASVLPVTENECECEAAKEDLAFSVCLQTACGLPVLVVLYPSLEEES